MTGRPRDTSEAWTNVALGDTIFLRADFKQQRFDPHLHEEYAIGVIDSGCQAFTYDGGRRLDMPKGSVALIAPGIVHTGWPGDEEGWRYRMFYPSAALIRQAAEDVFGRDTIGTFARPVVEDVWLHWLLSNLHDRSASPDAGPLEIERLYLAVVYRAFSKHADEAARVTSSIHAPGIRVVREVMEARFGEGLLLEELATIAGLNKFSLLRQFKAVYGLPPHAFLKLIRVRRASEMIAAGGSLAQIALMTGFADQAHMTRTFRSVVGYTPGILAP